MYFLERLEIRYDLAQQGKGRKLSANELQLLKEVHEALLRFYNKEIKATEEVLHVK